MIASTPSPNRFRSLGLKLDHWMHYYFGANALVAIVILILITIFLFREGIGFFPENLNNLRLYRQSGLEYVDIIRAQVDDHTALSRYLQNLRQKQLEKLLQKKVDKGTDLTDATKGHDATKGQTPELTTKGQTPELTFEQAKEKLAAYDQFIEQFDNSVDGLRSLLLDQTEQATAIKEKVLTVHDSGGAVPDWRPALKPLLATLPVYQQTSIQFRQALVSLLASAPLMPVAEFQPQLEKFKKLANQYESGFPAIEQHLKTWNPDQPIPWYQAGTSFLLGKEWITNSFWQDFYGVIPLLMGSILVSFVALMIAVPFGVCAAIYVNEFASIHEQRFIKPYIEFISAIPSVVLGFFGIAVLGESMRQASTGSLHWIPLIPWQLPPFNWIEHLFAACISWIPGFPMTERLNVFTAGALLALMAIPTIFSLSEDALNNVPRGFKEASFALGATRLQTVIRILIPASLSGIISAILLGFGRVIGETMVVLLCAGNRIAIPDFTQGFAAFFQPVHTMTGIIAQEMGEVVRGSIHYRALFMVGILLFFLSLGINYLAQRIVRKFKISIG